MAEDISHKIKALIFDLEQTSHRCTMYEVLISLKKAGYIIGIVSRGNLDERIYHCKSIMLYSLVDLAMDNNSRKFLYFREATNVSSMNTAVISDSERSVEHSTREKLRSYVIRTDNNTCKSRVCCPTVRHFFDSCDDVLNYFI
tara:strand:- start:1819 stop:2247 length:429 start_codon:yes stop_codon:yes gene_type:complete